MQIHWRNGDLIAEQARLAAEARLQNLAAGHTDLIEARIVARNVGHHRFGGEEVCITCRARGKELVASRTREEMGIALNEALGSFEREVHRMREKRRARRRGHLPELL